MNSLTLSWNSLGSSSCHLGCPGVHLSSPATPSARAPRGSQKRGPPQAFRALCPKMAPRFSQRLSRRPPDASRDSREGPRRHQEPPKRPRTTHKTPPKGPERLPNRPRPVSRRLLTRSPGLAIRKEREFEEFHFFRIRPLSTLAQQTTIKAPVTTEKRSQEAFEGPESSNA